MKAAVLAFSARGCETARRVLSALEGWETFAYTPERLAGDGFLPLGKPALTFYGELFSACDALIFVGSAGIAVREIAPHVRDKRTDPAVLCIDERGQYVIPLLSGHIGGANALSRRLAAALKALPVVTTATDINGRFSVDTWATERGLVIGDIKAAKAVSAAILEGDVPLCCDYPIVTALPSGTVPGGSGPVGICISCRSRRPFAVTLPLIPRILHLGIGCRRGIEESAVRAAVESVFRENELELRAVKGVYSIDLKADEAGLLSFCARMGWPAAFYSAEELQDVKGDVTPSAFVQSVTGVDNVCERAALLGAARLIVKKTAINGVTVAVAEEKLEVGF